MTRRLLNLLTTLSLLLCVAFAVVWAVSFFRCGEVRVGMGRPYGVFQVVLAASDAGQFRVGTVRERLNDDDPDPRRRDWWAWRTMSYAPGGGRPPRTLLETLRFDRVTVVDRNVSFARNGRPARHEIDSLGFPSWLAVAATAALPVARYRARQRLARRVARGQCLRCGYDLRATPGRCPECGHMTVGGNG